jgi:hypothetical protein
LSDSFLSKGRVRDGAQFLVQANLLLRSHHNFCDKDLVVPVELARGVTLRDSLYRARSRECNAHSLRL